MELDLGVSRMWIGKLRVSCCRFDDRLNQGLAPIQRDEHEAR